MGSNAHQEALQGAPPRLDKVGAELAQNLLFGNCRHNGSGAAPRQLLRQPRKLAVPPNHAALPMSKSGPTCIRSDLVAVLVSENWGMSEQGSERD